MFAQLTSTNFNIAENEHAEHLLQSLPDSYDPLVVNLTNNNVTDHIYFDDVAIAIIEEESIRINKEDCQESSKQVEALTMMRGRSMEHGPNGSQNHGRSKSRSKINLKCYNCGKKWNLKKHCWFKKNGEKSF